MAILATENALAEDWMEDEAANLGADLPRALDKVLTDIMLFEQVRRPDWNTTRCNLVNVANGSGD